MRIPRPPKVGGSDTPPDPTMPTPAVLDETDGRLNELPVRPRRRRVLMGELLGAVGDAKVTIKPVSPEKDQTERLHRELVRKYTKGGISEGEPKGYGATGGVVRPQDII